jgi:hypothetical protein
MARRLGLDAVERARRLDDWRAATALADAAESLGDQVTARRWRRQADRLADDLLSERGSRGAAEERQIR